MASVFIVLPSETAPNWVMGVRIEDLDAHPTKAAVRVDNTTIINLFIITPLETPELPERKSNHTSQIFTAAAREAILSCFAGVNSCATYPSNFRSTSACM